VIVTAILQQFFDYITREFLPRQRLEPIFDDNLQNRISIYSSSKLENVLNNVVSVLVVKQSPVAFLDLELGVYL
jgi:hypothetical protein